MWKIIFNFNIEFGIINKNIKLKQKETNGYYSRSAKIA